jgi:hypothetical protein
VDAAIVAICYLAASPKLQHMLLESGALAVLVPLLLQYDVTLSPEASTRLQLPFTTAGNAATAAAADGVQQQGPEASGLRLLDMALVRPNMQEARSQHALLAAQALARLAGEPHTAAPCSWASSLRLFVVAGCSTPVTPGPVCGCCATALMSVSCRTHCTAYQAEAALQPG